MSKDKNGRDPKGRFVEGNGGGPGRKPLPTERKYLTALTAVCSPEDWKTIAEKAVADAKEGDSRAREWLSSYLLGKPKGEAPSLFDMANDERKGVDEFDPLSGIIF